MPLLEYLANGLIFSSIIVLGSIGLSLVYSIADFANFAHGDTMTIGAYTALLTFGAVGGLGGAVLGLPYGFFVALLAGIAVAALVGVVTERVVYKPMDVGSIGMLITSIGIAFIYRAIIQLRFGADFTRYDVQTLRPIEWFVQYDIRITEHDVAIVLSAAILVTGARAAGKTTFLSALLRAVPADARTVVIEDAPELPVSALQSEGRDVQALRATAEGDGAAVSTADALRTALRLGESALAVGEVRGEEAAVLYEAMRVGAGASAVLGTIHGDGGRDVRERVVSDLGVPASSFAATDLVVTLADAPDGKHVTAIEEHGEAFAPIFERTPTGLESTGRLDRGESATVAALTASDETYADVLADIDARVSAFEGDA